MTYLGSKYQLPKDAVRVKEPIRIEESENELCFIRTYDETVIYTAQKAKKPGEHIPVVWESKDIAVSLSTLKRIYDGSDIATKFIIGVEQQVTRYKNTHYRWVIKLSRVYTIEQMEEAMEHCLKVDICTAQELAAFLIYRHGESVSREKMKDHLFYQCKHRAQQLREVLG